MTQRIFLMLAVLFTLVFCRNRDYLRVSCLSVSVCSGFCMLDIVFGLLLYSIISSTINKTEVNLETFVICVC